MKYIKGQDRNQTSIFPVSMEASIGQNNEVRIIDLFVDSLAIADMGFRTDFEENAALPITPKICSNFISMAT